MRGRPFPLPRLIEGMESHCAAKTKLPTPNRVAERATKSFTCGRTSVSGIRQHRALTRPPRPDERQLHKAYSRLRYSVSLVETRRSDTGRRHGRCASSNNFSLFAPPYSYARNAKVRPHVPDNAICAIRPFPTRRLTDARSESKRSREPR